MRHLYLGSVAFAILGTSALAADLPSRRAPPVYIPPPVPIFSWTGFYVGGQVGYEFGHDGLSVNGVAKHAPAGGEGGPVAVPVSLFGGSSPTGVIGGAHAGYNYALTEFGGGGLVVGVEGDVNGAGYKGVATSALVPGASATIKSDIKGSARGRLGFALDKLLVYGTGGAAFAEFRDSYASPVGAFSASHTRIGYTVGGGVEYAITPNWSLRAEYRYSDYGSFLDTGTVLGIGSGTARHRETDNIVQGGFSYKFDNPVVAPVVARY